MSIIQKRGIVRSYRKPNFALAASFGNWLNSRAFSPHTHRAYSHAVQDFLEFIRAQSALEVERVTIRQYLAHLSARGASSVTIARQLHALRSFFRFLVRANLIETDPTAMIRYRCHPSKLPRVLTEAEVTRLLNAATTTRDKAILEMLYATGCRVSELANMRVEDLDFTHRTVRVLGKGNKERVTLFGRKAAAALRKHLGNRHNGFVFEGSKGRPIGVRTIYLIVKRTALRVGLEGVHPHTLRHSCATHLLNRGVDLRVIQEILGHSAITSTQIYTHVSMTNLARIIRRCHPRGK